MYSSGDVIMPESALIRPLEMQEQDGIKEGSIECDLQGENMEYDALISHPFKSLKEIYANLGNLKLWPELADLRESAEYVFCGDQADVRTGKLRKINRDECPKTIVCHDMKGGYLEDRFIEGSTIHDSYLFYHWSVIDTFIYFSHYLVTIPPYGWINAAHKHGVKVLGTVITERVEGEQIWNDILISKNETKKFADALVHIAKFYKFEGWLLNIENKIKETDMEKLIYFVKYLTDSMHQEIEESEVLWYDSVTKTGQLRWQNELNDENYIFFSCCDGIFLNYNWTDEGLSKSRKLASDVDRIRDVYVGLDVWGRGCPGGGGFNSAYALDRIRRQDLSVAIFAPGWTHEFFGAHVFDTTESIFWAQLIPYLYIHVPIYDNEVFATSFCRGAGQKYFRSGKAKLKELPFDETPSTSSFYNLTMQRPQISLPALHLRFTETKTRPVQVSPTRTLTESTHETARSIIKVLGTTVLVEPKPQSNHANYYEFCKDLSYYGGGCLKLITEDPEVYHRLFLVHVDFMREIQVTVVHREIEKENAERQSGTSGGLGLILGNDFGLKSILPVESVDLELKWQKSVYLTDMRTVNEIGLCMKRKGSCYLGEIVLEEKQRRFGVVLVVFGVLVLVHGASLGGSGAGLWAGAGALVAGALGVVAALATSSDKPEMGQNQRTSGFSTAHLASSLVALALSNMAAITALTAVVRDSQRNPELTLLAVPEDDGRVIEVEGGWAGLLASVGLLVASVAELLVSAYTCVTLTPKLCRCLRSGEEGAPEETGLKTHNMVHQWVIAQSHVPKNQPIYVVQPVVPVHPIMQGPYGMPPPPGKYPPGFLPAGTLPLPGAGFKVPMVAHPQYGTRPPSQMVRPKHRRHSSEDLVDSAERRRHHEGKQESPKRMSSIGEDQVDLAQTYTGLDKKISEEFISIAMDPERKSKASSHHGSEVGSAVGGKSP
ncbi:uncharacterized protein LOC105701771 [Orussus abietinus]|uniref:uncharacterized protein LOC105701771 n=1 Tax=Orussus abietinus TaxID=222816 RepID=UPI000625F7EF|nr:uncharacterized protein LOC105701771 [Orussus abietinus]XP_012284249.1 uncharacterized protein LOC105701771 [Orussus abietinus]XP_012284250.1 uncharacterized protein LOC105701771 [Orussus abietinus]